MTFAAELDKARSYRHTLVRLTPARYVGDDLAAAGGGLYTMTFPYALARIERNGTALTEDASAPSSNDHWYHDESTGTLTVKLASAPNSTTNVVVAFYYVFLSSHPVSTYETPTDSASTVRPWAPRLAVEPRFVQSLSDVFYGILTVQASSFQVDNRDRWFQDYLTANDSFCDKTAEAWLVVNDQVQKAFTGVVTEIQMAAGLATIVVHDVFQKLALPAYMGDDFDDCYYLTSDYTTMSPQYNFRPCRFVFGRSRHAFKTYAGTLHGISSEAASSTLQVLDWEKCEPATPTFQVDLRASGRGSVNRGPWALCRASSSGLKTLNFGTILSATLGRTDVTGTRYNYGGAGNYKARLRFTYSVHPNNHNLEVGDSFSWSHPSVNGGATLYAVVMGVTLDIVDCLVLSRSNVTLAEVNVTTGTFNTNSAPAIGIRNVTYTSGEPLVHFLAYGLDYTLTETTLTSGNKFYTITLQTNFETALDKDGLPNHPNIDTGFPDDCVMFFRATTATSSSKSRHDEALKTLMTAAGLTCDATTFATAGSDFGGTVAFTIPSLEDTEYRPYFDYAQALLGSTLGYVSLNPTDGEVEYKLVAAPSSVDDVTSSLVLGDEPSVAIDYRDVVTSIAFANDHVPSGEGYWFSAAHYTVTSAKAKRLHGVERKLTVQHVLAMSSGQTSYGAVGSTRWSTILSLRSARRATYGFRLATKLLDGALGDDLQLTHAVVLGGGGVDDLKVTTLTKGADDVEVEATDLEGI